MRSSSALRCLSLAWGLSQGNLGENSVGHGRLRILLCSPLERWSILCFGFLLLSLLCGWRCDSPTWKHAPCAVYGEVCGLLVYFISFLRQYLRKPANWPQAWSAPHALSSQVLGSKVCLASLSLFSMLHFAVLGGRADPRPHASQQVLFPDIPALVCLFTYFCCLRQSHTAAQIIPETHDVAQAILELTM